MRAFARVAALVTTLVVVSSTSFAQDPAKATKVETSQQHNPPTASASAAASAAPAAPGSGKNPMQAGPLAPNTPVPPGHPPMGATQANEDAIDEQGAQGEGDDDEGAMPDSHGGAQLKDRSVRAPDLRPGTIEVHLRNELDQPLSGFPLRLGVMKQDVAEGDSRSQLDGKTNDQGIAMFSGLELTSSFSYRVTAQRDSGSFASEPIRLEPTSGQRVLLHVYPVTRDLAQALVGARGVVFVAAREDVFQFEASYQILNIGKQAWVPEHVTFTLPAGAKAFRASDSMNDTRVEKNAAGEIQLLGTFAPGEHDVSFQFQMENDHTRSRRFEVGLLPHVAEMRVIAERARGMSLEVEGFPESEAVTGRDGSRLLLTQKHLVRGDSPITSVTVGLDNLPVPAMGRWYALGIAASIAVGGLFEAGRRRKERVRTLPEDERNEAVRLVLDELVALEKARQKELVGPRTYEESKTELLAALSRLTPEPVAKAS